MKNSYTHVPAMPAKLLIGRGIQTLFILLIQLFCLTEVYAVTKTSVATGNWSDAAKWSPAGVPASTDDVIIKGGHVITIDGAYICNNLDLGNNVNANSTLQIIAAGNSLTINGDLRVNPNNLIRTYILNAGPGSINIAGTFSTWGTLGVNSIRVSTGNLTFTPSVTISSSTQNITFIRAGTITFNSDFNDNYNRLITYGGCNVNFNAGYNVSITAANWASGVTANFGNGSSITPNANIIFSNVQISTGASSVLNSGTGSVTINGSITLASGSTFTTNQNFEVSANWTNNGGTFAAGTHTVVFNGSGRLIDGTSPTTFNNLQIGKTAGATTVNYTLSQDITAQNLTINGSSAARTLTLGNGINLTVNGDLTIQQPIGLVLSSLAINAGDCSVGGDLTFEGADATTSKVARVSVSSGTLTVDGNVNWMSNTAVATEVITVSTGTITFGSPITMNDNSGTLTLTSSGTINFNGTTGTSFDFGGVATAPVFTTVANSTVSFKSGFTNKTNALMLNASSIARFTGSGTFTPTAAVTFGHVILDAGIVTLAGDMTIKGNWTNNGGNLSGGSNKVIFDGTSQTIDGTTSTDFPTLQVGASGTTVTVACTVNNDNSCANLVIEGTSSTKTFAINTGSVFTVTGNATINQPTADSRFSTLNVATGTCNVNGNLVFVGTSDILTRIGRVLVTSGNFELSGNVTWMSNLDVATEVISVSTGVITFGSPLSMGSSSGTLSVTSTGTINFNGTSGTSFEFGGVAVSPVFNTVAGCNLNFLSGFTNNANTLTLNVGSNSTFTGSGTYTPNAAVTFGNVNLSAGAIVTLAGNMLVKGDWFNYGGNLSGGTNRVVFDGAAQTIDGDSPTDFPDMQIGATLGLGVVSCTMNNSNTCTNLIIEGYSTNREINLTTGVTLDVAEDVTINQPTVNTRSSSLNINEGICNVAGNLVFAGVNTTTTRTGVVAVTSGVFNLTGDIIWMTNTSVATEVITVNTGTINFASSITMGNGSGTMAVTGAGTINFNGATSPSFSFGGVLLSPVLTTTAGCSLNFTNGFTNNSVSLTLAPGSNANFIDNGTITPNAGITFGNMEVYSGKTVTLAGNISAVGEVTLQNTAVLDESTYVLSGTADLNMASNSELKLQRSATDTYPELTGAYTLSGGTVIIKQNANTANVRGVQYYNLQLEGSRPFDIAPVTDISNNLNVQESTYFINNGALTIVGSLNYNSSATSTLATDITAGGVNLNSGTLNDAAKVITVNGTGGWVNNGGTFATTGTVVFTGGIAQEIGGNTATTFNALTINNPGGVTLNVNPAAATNVSGSLTLTNGIFSTSSSNILRVLDNATSSIGSDASYVEGPMVKVGNDNFRFPIGKGGRWRSASISSLSSTSTEVRAEYFNAAYEYLTPVTGDLQAVSTTEYWDIDRTGSADGVIIRLHWNTQGNIQSCTNLKIGHYKSGNWVEELSTVVPGSVCSTTGTGSIETNSPVTSFSPFTFGDGGGALPVKLVSFTAESGETTVETKWTTAVEINNDYFSVERSSDGLNFTEIDRVVGAGNSTATLHYEAIDEKPLDGVSYYRLRQTDFDGAFSYSDILSVLRQKISQITLFPNPVESELNLNISNISGNVHVNIFDVAGHEVLGKDYSFDSPDVSRVVTLSLRDVIPPGIYFVRVNSAGAELNQKIIVR